MSRTALFFMLVVTTAGFGQIFQSSLTRDIQLVSTCHDFQKLDPLQTCVTYFRVQGETLGLPSIGITLATPKGDPAGNATVSVSIGPLITRQGLQGVGIRTFGMYENDKVELSAQGFFLRLKGRDPITIGEPAFEALLKVTKRIHAGVSVDGLCRLYQCSIGIGPGLEYHLKDGGKLHYGVSTFYLFHAKGEKELKPGFVLEW